MKPRRAASPVHPAATGARPDTGLDRSPDGAALPAPGPERWLIIAVMLTYAAGYSVLCLYRHWGLNSSGLDLAMQAQVLWNTAHGRLFETSLEVANFLGDHVALIALPLAPLMWLPGGGVEWMLIFQSLALASAAWPLYRLTLWETRTRAWAVGVSFAFLLYPVLGFINRFDFHFVACSIPCLMWLVLFVCQGRMRAATIAAVLACLCREEVGVAVAGVAVYAALARGRRVWGLTTAVLAVTWSLVALFVIIPHFRGGPSDTILRYAWLGDTGGQIVHTLVTSPLQVARHLVGDANRMYTVCFLLWPLGLLPLLAPGRLLCVVPSLLICLLPDHESQNSIYFQYLAPVLPLTWWAAVGGAAELTRRLAPKSRPVGSATAAGLLVACTSLAFAFENPVTTTLGAPFWTVQTGPPRPNVAAFRAAAASIEPREAVLATMALAPHLAERRQLAIVAWETTVREPDVVLLDITDWRWFGDQPYYARELTRWIRDPAYGVRFWQDGLVLLRRGQASTVDRAAVLAALQEQLQALPPGMAP